MESGLNWRVPLTEAPGGNVVEVELTLVMPNRVASAPAISIYKISRSAVPSFFTVTVSGKLVVPTGTEPKFIDLGVTVISGAGLEVAAL
jgi:hypothetical protein